MLLAQAFLRSKSLAELTATYAIGARRHGEYPNLVQLKYNQRESPMDQPIVQECRGLILDEADHWSVVAFPFTKFFNADEPLAAAIDWSTARVFEKLDGSLMTLYWYGGQWRVASSSIPDAAGRVGTGSFSFADLFWRTWRALSYPLPAEIDWRRCFMFELMSQANRIVVRHERDRLALIGVRDLQTLDEADPEPYANAAGWECVGSLPLTSMVECRVAARVLAPLEAEGYVVRDARFHRIKIKSPAYVAIAHQTTGMSPRRLLEIASKGERSEFLSYFPRWRAAMDHARQAFEQLCQRIDADYDQIAPIVDRKEFALRAAATPYAAVMFALRDKRADNARGYFAGLPNVMVLQKLLPLDIEAFARMETESE